jgi:flagellar biosynthesis GTPase FlhF
MRKHVLKAVSILSVALALALFAPQRAAADDDDPPSRVARLGFARGSVSFNPAGTDDWVSAVVNRPVTTGDKLWNDSDGRSELSIGSAVIRLGSTTGFSFLNLTDNTTQIRVTEGTLNIRVRNLGDDETFEVDTPNLAFTVLRPGNYKIVVNEAGDTTTVVVRDGQGEVTGGGSAYTVHPGEIGAFVGTDQLDADVESWGNDDDDFDDWCADRDRRIDHSVSARYVSTDAIGYEDLDEYGGWRPVPEYGTIWFPHVTVVGWAPYHYGHWAYIAPWGYTWVDDAPWGFAPFHYGRWVTVGGVWGWEPCAPRPVAVVGVAYVRPVYAPALVAWVGGPHFGVGIGVGGGGFAAGVNVGWFPLGPREVYVPSYPVSRTYVNNVNVSNTTVNTTVVNNYYNTTVVNRTTNVTVNNQHYMNQGVPGAVSATTPQAFTSAQSVSKNSVVVNQREVASAPVAATTPPVAPARQAVLGSGAPAAAKPPAALANRPVVAKTAPPPPPVSFAKQQQAIQANGGKPLAASQVRQIQPEAAQTRPNIKIAPPSKPATPRNVQANQTGGPQPAANPNRPGTPNNVAPPAQVNKPAAAPANTGSQNASQKTYTDRPAAARPSNANAPTNSNAANAANAQLEQKHQQQLEQLRSQQDQERQKVEQQQVQERQKAQQEADAAKQQKLNQQHQQQLEQLEQKHDQEEQKLKQTQQQEAQKAKPAKNPPKEKDDKPPKAKP